MTSLAFDFGACEVLIRAITVSATVVATCAAISDPAIAVSDDILGGEPVSALAKPYARWLGWSSSRPAQDA